MINRIGIKISLIVGLAIAGAGVYFGYKNIQKSIFYGESEGVITGFHAHSRDDYYPDVAFLYKGDSIFSKIDYYSTNMEIGQPVVVIFPPNDPESAEIKSSLLFEPLFLLFFSLFFIFPSILTIKSKSQDENIKAKKGT